MEDYIVYRSDVERTPDDRFREYSTYDVDEWVQSDESIDIDERPKSRGNARDIALKNTRATLELVQAGLNINLVAEILIRAFPGNYLTSMKTINYRCDYCHDWIDDYGNTCYKHGAYYCNNCANMYRCQGSVCTYRRYPEMCRDIICKECEYEVVDGDKYHTECKSNFTKKCEFCYILPKRNGRLIVENCSVCGKTVCGGDLCTRYCLKCHKYYCNVEGDSHGRGDLCNNCRSTW